MLFSENLIFFIILKLDSISNSYDIKGHIFEFNSFYSKNLFNSNKVLLDGIKKNLKRENIMNITEKEDIFDEIFNLNFLDDIKDKKESNIIKLKENDTNVIQYILFSFCEYIFENNYNNLKSDEIGKYLRFPYILSNDYPNYLLLQDLLINNKDNEDYLLIILLIVYIHINSLKKIEMNICQIFGDENKTEKFIDVLMEISIKNKNLENICLIIILKILTISNLNISILEKIIDLISPNNEHLDEDFLIDKKDVLNELYNYCLFSKTNILNILSSKKLYEFNNKLIKVFFKENNNLYFNQILSSFKYYFKYLFSYILKNNQYHEMYCNITNLIFKLSKDYLNKYNSLNEKFEIRFLKFCLNSSFYNELPNYFSLLNWNDLFEIIKKLSEIKSQNDNNTENKYDIIFDNFSFSNEQPKYLLFSLPNSDKSSLYIEEFMVQKEILKNKNTLVLGVIEEITNSQEIYKIEYINHEKQFTYSNIIINDLDIKDGIKIRFNPEANNFFVKVRISNYKFFNEKIVPLLKPCIELFNKILKKLSFYLGYDDKITNLFNTRLFSLGIPKNKNKDKNNSDLKLFE